MSTTNSINTNTDTDSKSFFTLRNISLIFVAIGLAITAYLSYVKIADVEIICVEGSEVNCDAVQTSVYSTFDLPVLGKVPVAYFGFLTYALIGILLLLENRIGFLGAYGPLIVFVIVLFGWLFSMWLVYVQFALLQTLCPWCLGHELNFTLLLGVTILRLWKSLKPVSD